jgi:hypothetical protein
VKAELVCDLGDGHGVLGKRTAGSAFRLLLQSYYFFGGMVTHRKILLVGEDEEKGVPQLILVEHALQLLTSLGHTVAVIAVDDEDDALGILEVVAPQGANLVLTTDVPHGELDVAVLDGLDVEA